MSLYRSFLPMLGDETLVDQQRHLAQSVERLVPVFGKNPALVFGKNHVEHPVHGFDLPVVAGDPQQLLGGLVQVGDVIAGLICAICG